MPELGGRRPRSELPTDVNGFWRNESFHNYADYALSRPFHDALRELLSLGDRDTCAVMCAEAVWWRCHRRIITDYLLYHGADVVHLMGDGRTQAARLTDSATPAPGGGLVYPGGDVQPEKR